VLLELRVENLLLLERAELRLAAGLNVLTGETGAGKTVLAHALDLLLGGRARANVVRPGAAEACVEGVFELPEALRERLGDRLPEGADELVLARRVSAEGRTRAYLNGRAAAVGDLREVATPLVSFYGQHEHRKLTLASAQLDVLDSFCGAAQGARRAAHAAAHGRARELEARLAELRERAGSRERELDLLRFELEEIEAAAPDEAEERELRTEAERLRHLEGLRAAAAAGAEAVSPEAGGPGAGTLLAEGGAALDGAAGVDPELDGLAERLRAALYEVEDLGGELRRYAESLEAEPGRLEEVEERLAVLERLKRKHGGSVAAVLEHARRCRERHEELAGAEEALEEVGGELARAQAEGDELAAALGQARRAAAPLLAAAVRERLAELAMEGAGFEVALEPRAARGPAGDDSAEFLIAPNPGVPAGPLREIASGGELSRVMLALMGVAAEGGAAARDGVREAHRDGAASPAGGDASAAGNDASRAGGDTSAAGNDPSRARGDAPLLVFDEVDAGIGGHTARAVGERLRGLAAGRQVLCITHLPQVASLAERHFRIEKDAATVPARATVAELRTGDVVRELVRMLGADAEDPAARRHARSLLKAA
jgi:DNA repair protein RecN (Recombination protein N)